MPLPMLLGYPDAAVPAWCELPPPDHHDGVGGCWGISHGFVAEQGRAYCETCEFCDRGK